MKKLFGAFTTIAVALTATCGVLASTDSTEFTDTDSHWAKTAIARFADENIVSGYQGEFRPNDTITRGEIATIIDRIMQYQVQSVTTGHFDDLDDAFYTEPLLKTNSASIILGNGTSINPLGNATREEAVTILARAMHFDLSDVANTTNFADDTDISNWAKPAISFLNEQGIISGKTETTFDPKSDITRAEFVTLLDKSIGMLVSDTTTLSEDIQGNVIVNTSGVAMQYMEIDGDLILAEGIGEGDIFLDNVKITGNVTVKGGGENSVYFNEVVVDGFVIIEKEYGAVRLVTSGVDGITRIEISGDVIINSENQLGDSMTEIVINGGDSIVLIGNFGDITNNQDNVELQIIGTVENLTMNADANINGNEIVSGDHQTSVPTESSTGTSSDSSSSGSSSSGSSSSGSTATTYAITIDSEITNGTVTVDKTSAPIGGVVTITATPDTGYVLTSLTAVNSFGNAMTITDNQFTMSVSSVVVSATFTPGTNSDSGSSDGDSDSSDGGSTGTTYAITIDSEITNGTVTVDKTSAPVGGVVTITATPDTGYVLTSLTAVNSFGNAMTITGNQFTMSVSSVVVSATFSPTTGTGDGSTGTGDDYSIRPYVGITNGTLSVDKASADAGDTVMVLATPSTSYQLVELFYYEGINRVDIPTTNNLGAFVMPSQDVVLYATFSLSSSALYTITVDSTITNGTVTTDKLSATFGSVVTITATPDDGYALTKLTATNDFGNAMTIVDNQFTMSLSHVIVSAEFSPVTPDTYTITPYNDIENGLLMTSQSTATVGDSIIVTAIPDSGYELSELYYLNGLTKVDIPVTNSGGSFLMPSQDIVLYATFTAAPTSTQFTISVASNLQNGSLSVVQKDASDNLVPVTFASANDLIFVLLTPEQDYVVDELYYMSNGYRVDIDNSFKSTQGEFNMPAADVTIYATFLQSTPTGSDITIGSNITNGSITSSLSAATEGTTVTVTATPASGYQLNTMYYMMGSDTETIAFSGNTGTFTMPDGAVTLYAEFSLTTSTGETGITLNVSSGGTAWISGGASSVTAGQTVIISTSADTNYEVTEIYYILNGVTVDVLDKGWKQGEFNMPAASIEVFVVFELVTATYTITADPSITNGTISFSRDTADKGNTVFVYAVADEGYSVSTTLDGSFYTDHYYTYTDSTGAVTTEKLRNLTGSAYFSMPESDVVVYVEFISEY